MAFHHKILTIAASLVLAASLILAAGLPTRGQADGTSLAPAAAAGSAFPTSAAEQFLPVEEAFVLSSAVDQQDIELIWIVAPGYYLYRHKFAVQQLDGGIAVGEPLALEIEPGIRTHDEYYGAVEIYYHQALARLRMDALPGADIELAVSYQGCAEAGLCYPTQTRHLKFSGQTTATGHSGQPTSKSGLF